MRSHSHPTVSLPSSHVSPPSLVSPSRTDCSGRSTFGDRLLSPERRPYVPPSSWILIKWQAAEGEYGDARQRRTFPISFRDGSGKGRRATFRRRSVEGWSRESNRISGLMIQAEGSGISTELRERIWWPEAGTIPLEFGFNPREAENNMKFGKKKYLKLNENKRDLPVLFCLLAVRIFTYFAMI
ncbi:hypothetical protein OROHE_011478 [Orobanche hederae]